MRVVEEWSPEGGEVTREAGCLLILAPDRHRHGFGRSAGQVCTTVLVLLDAIAGRHLRWRASMFTPTINRTSDMKSKILDNAVYGSAAEVLDAVSYLMLCLPLTCNDER